MRKVATLAYLQSIKHTSLELLILSTSVLEDGEQLNKT